jgi:hypothetical protein
VQALTERTAELEWLFKVTGAAGRLDRLEIQHDRLYLVFGQVLDDTVHHRRIAQGVLNHQNLLQQIGRMLPGQPRKCRDSLSMRPVA